MHDLLLLRTSWILGVLQATSVLMKLAHVVSWSWWLVLSPVLVVCGLFSILTLAIFVYCCIREVGNAYHIYRSTREFYRD